MFKNKILNLIIKPQNKYKLKKIDGMLRTHIPGYEILSSMIISYINGLIYKKMYADNSKDKSNDFLWKIKNKANVYSPLVSIIVPNYNHDKYLKERLESIYNQTYKNYEVILLDDCSTDNSVQILESYLKKYNKNTRMYVNTSNSKNVFKQWGKGISFARGNLIWIAESDDFCDANFLETLVPSFKDEAVMLSFCRSDFIRNDKKVFSTEQYLSDITKFDWLNSFCVTAYDFVRLAMSIKNVIPNVSSTIFRRRLYISCHIKKLIESMQLCGDWVFYIYLIRGGCVYYSPRATNYYRIHNKSTSLKVQSQINYYKEHEKVSCYIAENYKVPLAMHKIHLDNLKKHYLSFHGDKNVIKVEKWFDLYKIANFAKKYRPTVLMCVYSMTIGGGETFAIFLANELSKQGVSVTVADFQMDRFNISVRNMLHSDVPYIPVKQTKGLKYILMRFGIDIVHTHHGMIDGVMAYALLKNKQDFNSIKHVITLHGMYETKDETYLKNLLKRIQVTCSAYIYIADKNLIPFKHHGYNDFKLFYKIGNGLPFYPGKSLPRNCLNISHNAFVFCIVSRGIPEKGWQVAAKAISIAREKTSMDLELLLVGNGEMYDKMKNTSPTYIHLVGFKSNVRDYIATSDMGLLPSEFKGESFPLFIIDCLFCGKPVIASNVGEVKNQLRNDKGDRAGLVFDLVNDKVSINKLVKLIVKVVSNKKLYAELQSNASSVAKKYYIENVAKKYLQVYQQCYIKQNKKFID